MADCCSNDITVLYSCSGAADVGEIADRVTRELRGRNFGTMSCLAGIGAGISGYVQTAKGAGRAVSIDGCATLCARKNLERIGVSPESYVVTDFGLQKGAAPVTDDTVRDIADRVASGAAFMNKGNSAPASGCGCGGKC